MPLDSSYIGSGYVNARSNNRQIALSNLVHYTFTNPLTLDADGFSVSHLGAGTAGTTSQTLGGALTTTGVGINAHPRNVVITVTHASAVVAMSGVITGTNFLDDVMTEAWSVTAGTTSKTFTGKKGFKTITSITEVVAADASANTIISGTGIVLGVPVKITVNSLVKEQLDGAIVTNGTLVAGLAGATTDTLGTYLPNTAPDGAHDYDLWFISDDPWNS